MEFIVPAALTHRGCRHRPPSEISGRREDGAPAALLGPPAARKAGGSRHRHKRIDCPLAPHGGVPKSTLSGVKICTERGPYRILAATLSTQRSGDAPHDSSTISLLMTAPVKSALKRFGAKNRRTKSAMGHARRARLLIHGRPAALSPAISIILGTWFQRGRQPHRKF